MKVNLGIAIILSIILFVGFLSEKTTTTLNIKDGSVKQSYSYLDLLHKDNEQFPHPQNCPNWRLPHLIKIDKETISKTCYTYLPSDESCKKQSKDYEEVYAAFCGI